MNNATLADLPNVIIVVVTYVNVRIRDSLTSTETRKFVGRAGL